MAEYQIQADAVFEDGERSSYRPKRLKVLSSLAMPAVLLTVVYIRGTSGEISLNTPAVNPVTERFIKVTGSVQDTSVKAVVLNSNFNSQRITVIEGDYEVVVPLQPGENHIQATYP